MPGPATAVAMGLTLASLRAAAELAGCGWPAEPTFGQAWGGGAGGRGHTRARAAGSHRLDPTSTGPRQQRAHEMGGHSGLPCSGTAMRVHFGHASKRHESKLQNRSQSSIHLRLRDGGAGEGRVSLSGSAASFGREPAGHINPLPTKVDGAGQRCVFPAHVASALLTTASESVRGRQEPVR